MDSELDSQSPSFTCSNTVTNIIHLSDVNNQKRTPALYTSIVIFSERFFYQYVRSVLQGKRRGGNGIICLTLKIPTSTLAT